MTETAADNAARAQQVRDLDREYVPHSRADMRNMKGRRAVRHSLPRNRVRLDTHRRGASLKRSVCAAKQTAS